MAATRSWPGLGQSHVVRPLRLSRCQQRWVRTMKDPTVRLSQLGTPGFPGPISIRSRSTSLGGDEKSEAFQLRLQRDVMCSGGL